MPSRGIVYSATGARYIAEAIVSAGSSLRFNNVPHIIYCDDVLVQPRSDIQFEHFASCGNGYLDKIGNMARTPFEQTIFLDSDTYVLDRIDELFDLLRRFDIAAAQVSGYTKCADSGQSEAYYDFNSGIIAYRSTEAVKAFFANWRQLCADWFRSPPFPLVANRDQAALRRALWDSALSLHTLSPEYNYRSVFPGRLVGKAKIIHGRSKNYEKLAAHLNTKSGPRIFDRFPPEFDWL